MQRRKTHLQKHRLKAFTSTLEQVSTRIDQKIKFLEDYAEVYKMPVMLTRKNLQQLRNWQRAADTLKSIQLNQL